MKIIEFRTLSRSRSETFTLIPLGDEHLGTKNCDEEKLREMVGYIQHKDNCYWISMADICEFINMSDPRWSEEVMADWTFGHFDDLARTQVNYAVDMLYPIRYKCIGMLRGNHETAIKKHMKYDAHAAIIEGLWTKTNPIQDLTYTTFVRWIFDRKSEGTEGKPQSKTLIIFATHGHGYGRYLGGKANNVVNLAKGFDADLYLFAHVHDKQSFSRDYLTITRSGEPKLQRRKRIFILTGSFLRTYVDDSTSYAEEKCYEPLPTGVVKVTIEPWKSARYGDKTYDEPIHLHTSE